MYNFLLVKRGRHWDFRFWLIFRSVFWFLLQKTSVFRFWWSLRFADFSFFSIWFSVFVKNTSGFSVLVPDVVFGFSYFVLFWVPVSVRFEQHLISNSRETPKLFRGMRDKINVMVGDQASPLTPGETLNSQTRAIIWSVCEVWLPTYLPRPRAPAPATEEAIVDCVAFFYEEGKGGENFRKKNKFRCKVKRAERSLQKLKNSVWYVN